MNFNITDKRRLVSYFQATSNEIALDILCYKMLNISPEMGNYVPRPTKLINYSKNVFFKIFKVFWEYIFGYVFFIKQLFTYLVKKVRIKKEEKIIKNKSVGIAFSNRAIDVINEKNCNICIDYWIVFPWTDCSKLEKKYIKIELLSLLTVGELMRACLFSFCAHKRMSKVNNYKKWILQSYTSFQWFVVRIALEKIEANFFIADHFDRWAVMADGILIEQHRNGFNSSLALVQHGLVGDIGNEVVSLPYKFCKFKRLYLYNKAAEDYFKKNILVENNVTLKDVKFFNNLLAIKEIPKTDCVSILFVGHSICRDLHIFILNELIAEYNLKVYYKPHPTEKNAKLIYEQNWIVIEDKHFFPAVDFLISYPSTLAYEYELLGIDSVVHPIDLKVGLVKSFLKELERKIDSYLILKKEIGIRNKKNVRIY